MRLMEKFGRKSLDQRKFSRSYWNRKPFGKSSATALEEDLCRPSDVDSGSTQRPRILGRGDGSFLGSARGHTCGLHDRLDFMVQRLPTKVRTREFEPHRSV